MRGLANTRVPGWRVAARPPGARTIGPVRTCRSSPRGERRAAPGRTRCNRLTRTRAHRAADGVLAVTAPSTPATSVSTEWTASPAPPSRARSPSASTPRRSRTGCAGSRESRSSARCSGSRRAGRRSGSSCATPVRRAAVLDVARGLRQAQDRGARGRGAGRRGGRVRLLPRLADRVAVVLVRGHAAAGRRRGGSARAARPAAQAAARRGAVRAAEGSSRGRGCRSASAS